MSDIQTDDRHPHSEEAVSPPSRKPTKPKASARSKSQSNQEYYKSRKSSEAAIHLWLPEPSAKNLDACRDLVAASRGGPLSRGSLVAIFADELTERRMSDIALLYPDLDIGMALASALAKGLDGLISDGAARNRAAEAARSRSENAAGASLGAATEPQPRSETGSPAADPSAGTNSQPMAAPASIIEEFDMLFGDAGKTP